MLNRTRSLAALAAVGGLLAAAAPASAEPSDFIIDGPYTLTGQEGTCDISVRVLPGVDAAVRISRSADGKLVYAGHAAPPNQSAMRITIYDALITSYMAPARDLCREGA